MKIYDKDEVDWHKRLDEVAIKIAGASGERHAPLEDKVERINTTDMAVVVSPSQNEIAEMRTKGVDIQPHRKRMVAEDLDVKFKVPDRAERLPLRLNRVNATITSTSPQVQRVFRRGQRNTAAI